MTASWKSHYGSVWKVTWAHPEFSQVLATCSFDRTAAIWEEIPGSDLTQGNRSTFFEGIRISYSIEKYFVKSFYLHSNSSLAWFGK